MTERRTFRQGGHSPAQREAFNRNRRPPAAQRSHSTVKHDWRYWYEGDIVHYQCKRCGKTHKF